jgi:CelD/BcsL family acetyltransferase involved in cellulose biosynthesis
LHCRRRRVLGRHSSVLEVLGTPDALDRPRFLVAEGDEETMFALLGTIARHRDTWDVLQLDEMESSAWQGQRIATWARQSGLRYRQQALHPVPYLQKSGDWEHFLRGRSRHFARRLRDAERRVQRDHELTYQHSHGANGTAALVERFFEVEARSWKAKDGLDVGSEPAYRDFYHDLLRTDTRALCGHAFMQCIDTMPSAVTLGFSSGSMYYSLQIAHDARFDRLSPGTLLEAYEMQWFHANPELKRYEFLGGAGANKQRWTRTAVDTDIAYIYKPGVHMALADLCQAHVMPLISRLRGDP